MEWRDKNYIPLILRDDLREEFKDGAVYWYGVDKMGRPILWEKFEDMNWSGGFESERKIR